MSYTCPGASTPRLNLISNPWVTTSGRAVGDAGNGHCTRRLTETRSAVANARPQRVAAPVGSLVNWLGGRRCLDAPTWDTGRQVRHDPVERNRCCLQGSGLCVGVGCG